MNTRLFSFYLLLLLAVPAFAADFASIRPDAERLFEEKSYSRALEAYKKVNLEALGEVERRWVQFRLLDCEWRSLSSTRQPNNARLNDLVELLNREIRDLRGEDQDRVWTEVQESLGDFHWYQRHRRNWYQAWSHYQQALDWWAGSPDLDLARERYIDMVRKVANPLEPGRYYHYGYLGNYLPIEVIKNFQEIAQADEDRALGHFMAGTTLMRSGGGWREMKRVPEEFEKALALGKGTDWYDNALYSLAQWMERSGRVEVDEKRGTWSWKPDYVKALALYRRLTSEFKEGESRHVRQAENQIRNITRRQLNLGVESYFLPGSAVRFSLHWRNVREADFVLYKVDLSKDASLPANGDKAPSWLESVDLGSSSVVHRWDMELEGADLHEPGHKALPIDKTLEKGAYVLEVTGGGEKDRELILISDLVVVTKSVNKDLLVWVTELSSGVPVEGASVSIWERHRGNNRRYFSRQHQGVSDKDGLLKVRLAENKERVDLFVAASKDERQSFATSRSYLYRDTDREQWKIYAVTDRPAYRPGEKVLWKFSARIYDGETYETPASRKVHYSIVDPRGTKVDEGEVALNDFGTAWLEWQSKADAGLGMYRVQFHTDKDQKRSIGTANLFRLEEYKLPEFKVEISTGKEDGKPKLFQLGDEVEVEVQADYYFGGAVADADVEVIVRQKPYYHRFIKARAYPWFFDDEGQGRGWNRFGNGQELLRQKVKTDAAGRAVVKFTTPEHEGQDQEYSVEARVTDASRREIVANGSVKVTREPFFVDGDVEGRIHKPGDKVAITFTVQDANGNGVETQAKVRVVRKVWREIWIDPRGREVLGNELMQFKKERMIFPPPTEPGWRPKVREYEDEEIEILAVASDANGKAQVTFTPDRPGYFEHTILVPRPNREGLPIAPPPVTGSVHTYVTRPDSNDNGYHGDEIEIVVDGDTFEVGNQAPVMLVSPVSGRHVLFTVESETLMDVQVVRIEGTVKLLQLAMEDRHVPNFELHAMGIVGGVVQSDMERVVVPPTKEFLTVEVSADDSAYKPGEEGELKVKVTDHKGNPLATELSLAVYDESVDYIQGDLAGDPRKFFYNFKRGHHVRTASTLSGKRFQNLVERDGRIYEEEEYERLKERLMEAEAEPLEVRDVVAGERANYAMDASAMPMAAPAMAKGQAMGRSMGIESQAMFAGAKLELAKSASAQPQEEAPNVQVRSDFRSTIAWIPDLATDEEGHAVAKVKFADSLTTWKALVRGISAATKVGWGETKVKTRLPLTARFQSPRFLTVGDEARVGVILNNNTEKNMKVMVSLDASGVSVRKNDDHRSVRIPAGGEKRVEWKVDAKSAGDAKFVVKAWSDDASDGMERTIPVQEHGIERFLSRSGRMDGKGATVVLDIPRERRQDSTEMVVQIAPSMATTMLDALPYLIDYPYGCTEQTLSRFLPAAVVAKTLKDMGLNEAALMDRTFGGMSKTGRARAKKGAGLEKLTEVTAKSLDRLYDFQQSDGGWAWWKEGQADPYMTAYVVWGLSLAKQAGVDVRDDVLERGENWLDRRLVQAENQQDMQAWMLHALAVRRTVNKEKVASEYYTKAFDRLWKERDQLNAYTRALFLLAAHLEGRKNEAGILLRNLENGVIRDDRPDQSVLLEDINGRQSDKTIQATAHWGNDGLFHRWSDGGVEATAWALRAILAVDPKHELVAPVSNWLVKNRRGAQWNNTRDTAMVVLALNDYLQKTGEAASSIDLTVQLNGEELTRKKLTPEQALMEPIRIEIPTDKIKDGKNRVKIVRNSGKGPIYFAVESTFFSLEEPIPAGGNEVFVKRSYERITHQPTLLKGLVEKVLPLEDGDKVISGDRIKVTLTIESKNHYEYLLFEDLKPAGFESVELQSGGGLRLRGIDEPGVDRLLPPGFRGGSHVHRELRDSKVALFVDRLPEGFWQIQYEFRAETPGQFHALPVMAEAMYVPEIRANSREFRVQVQPDPKS